MEFRKGQKQVLNLSSFLNALKKLRSNTVLKIFSREPQEMQGQSIKYVDIPTVPFEGHPKHL